MESKKIKLNKNFVGRAFEFRKLEQVGSSKEASIIVVYGRRRVGKTELLEQAFRKRNIIKIEGIEGKNKAKQIESVLWQLGEYLHDPLIIKLNLKTWKEVFQLISKHINSGIWTLYFEEVQWLASYGNDFITDLKYAWDNFFKQNENLILILCGSSPSFMINNVLHSKALYNRSQHEIYLKEFSLKEIHDYFGMRSNEEVMDACLSVGGIPEYLRYLSKESSVFLGLCKNSFTTGGFFTNEYERIFTSSLASNVNYKKVVELLSNRKFATRNEIVKHLETKSGGTTSNLLKDLELCGFIEKYTPFNLYENSLLARYNISDQYLQFYFKFIEPLKKNIENGEFNNNPASAINTDTYVKWQGYAFERFLRKNHKLVAKILGFEAVKYKSGAFFSRNSDAKKPGFQIDLVFQRNDKVNTVCEIKYLRSQVTPKIILEFEEKLSFFTENNKGTIQKVLIAAQGASESLINQGYFDRIITLKDLFL